MTSTGETLDDQPYLGGEGEIEGQTVIDDQQIGESVLRAEPEHDDEDRRRTNMAYAFRFYAEQRRNGHIPYPGDGWKYRRVH